jgi:hypothetical protein
LFVGVGPLGKTSGSFLFTMESIITAMMLGIIAKFFEKKLEKTFEKEYIEIDELPVQERTGFEAYS